MKIANYKSYLSWLLHRQMGWFMDRDMAIVQPFAEFIVKRAAPEGLRRIEEAFLSGDYGDGIALTNSTKTINVAPDFPSVREAIEPMRAYFDEMPDVFEGEQFLDMAPGVIEKVLLDDVDLIRDWHYREGNRKPHKLGGTSWMDAWTAQQAWHERLRAVGEREEKERAKRPNKSVDLPDSWIRGEVRFDNGWRWVRLATREALTGEGRMMGHCVANYTQYLKFDDPVEHEKRLGQDMPAFRRAFEHLPMANRGIWSLRDPRNLPHLTMQVDNGQVRQCTAKGNAEVPDAYYPYVAALLKERKIDWKFRNGICGYLDDRHRWRHHIGKLPPVVEVSGTVYLQTWTDVPDICLVKAVGLQASIRAPLGCDFESGYQGILFQGPGLKPVAMYPDQVAEFTDKVFDSLPPPTPEVTRLWRVR